MSLHGQGMFILGQEKSGPYVRFVENKTAEPTYVATIEEATPIYDLWYAVELATDLQLKAFRKVTTLNEVLL